MSSRSTRESGGGVLSFTFLDVLTCTMGSLVLLVVIIGQKAAHTRLEDALRNGPRRPTAPTAVAEAPEPPKNSPDPSVQLAKFQADEAKLAALRTEAAERLRQERSRVSHLEDHERRLEHDLAKLQIALERLQAAEQDQTVDQKSAEGELAKLKQLVKDTELQLDELRSEAGGKKSFAIVPYQGANGTYRRPIYIECTKDAVTIQPEGIQLTAIDFDGPIRSGNPLAAAVRAAREELNARAAAAGQTDLPDPYPLLIVRPDGARAYSAALSAISAWDADYGYEFVDADWKLEFPAADPRLGQAMTHAVEQARTRQAMLAKVAPRRYGSRLTAAAARGPGGGGAGGTGDAEGFDVLAEGSAGDRIGEHGGDADLATIGGGAGGSGHGKTSAGVGGSGGGSGGGGSAGGASAGGSEAGNFADQFPATASSGGSGGESRSGGGGSGGAEGLASTGGANGDGTGQPAGGAAASGGAGVAGGVPGGTAAAGSTAGGSSGAASMAGGSGGATSGGGASSAGGSSAAGGTQQASGGQAGGVIAVNAPAGAKNDSASAAETRGANWANAAASRRATPITRPIQAVVRPGQLDVLPAREDAGASAAAPTVVTFNQPTDKVLDELASVLQQQIREWGAAGQDMYWRPTLMLQVAPGADRHAARLNDLLRDSGVDVRLQRLAARPAGEATDARR